MQRCWRGHSYLAVAAVAGIRRLALAARAPALLTCCLRAQTVTYRSLTVRVMSEPVINTETIGDERQNQKVKHAAVTTVTTTATTNGATLMASPLGSSTIKRGALKDFTGAMADKYEPAHVESQWDDWWSAQGLYRPASDDDPSIKDEPFVMVIPPPNVTGTLHLGHALTCSIEDAIIRYYRMCGRNVLWVPGTDHAGIATQVVVEKKLMRERQLTRHDLGREEFIREVWKWRETNGSRINSQIRRLGASVDWSREAFTMDDNLSAAVQSAFLTFHKRGLIYRSNRLVNWSCALRTAISSIEVEHLELTEPTLVKVPDYSEPIEFGVIHSFAYQLTDSDDEIVVATTRIETMLGDVAVAVHPNDERYTKFHGKQLKHPFIEGRTVAIITDPVLVDMSYGTGAVKVTPAHDPNDFACGQRNKLASVNIFTDDGLVNDNGGTLFQGLKRFDARSKVIEALKSRGLYRGKAANPMSLGLCSRSKDIVEPVLRPQWWVNCQSMASQAVQRVKDGELRILPESHTKVWYSWLDNIQDWCISRQLWWGHRIPAYYVTVPSHPNFNDSAMDENEYWVCARNVDEARAIAAKKWPQIAASDFVLTQDPDVLDTWFSSGLFPFSTLGWPNTDHPDYNRFYPNTLLETGHDILFFWVARMVMMGLELTGKLPFTTIYLHAMVRDKLGRKMSKSLGNVVDPIDVIQGISLQDLHAKLLTGNLDPAEVERARDGQSRDFPDGIGECGADALRFGLLAYSAQGRDINLDVQRVVAYRHFGNKLWQATRFALLNFDASFQRPPPLSSAIIADIISNGSIGDAWILSRLSAAVSKMNTGFLSYEFSDCTTAIYNFWLYDLCDVYLELLKPIVKDSSENGKTKRTVALNVLYYCLEHGLLLLHPLMPFITEELYHRLPQANQTGTGGRSQCGSIMVRSYPQYDALYQSLHRPDIESLMVTFQDITKAVRQTRANLGLGNKMDLELLLLSNDSEWEAKLSQYNRDIGVMCNSSAVRILTDSNAVPAGSTSAAVNERVQLFIPLIGKVDFSAELIKLEKSLETLTEAIRQQRQKIATPGYEKQKAELREKNAAKLASDESEAAKLSQSIQSFYALMTASDRQSYRESKRKAKGAELERIKVSMNKFLPAGQDEAKLPKKVAGKYAELKAELQKIEQEIEQLDTAE